MVAVPSIPAGFNPTSVAIAATANGTYAYVSNFGDISVTVIDTATNLVVNSIPVAFDPNVLAVTPDQGHIYLAIYGNGTVSVIDTSTNSVPPPAIAVGTNPVG